MRRGVSPPTGASQALEVIFEIKIGVLLVR